MNTNVSEQDIPKLETIDQNTSHPESATSVTGETPSKSDINPVFSTKPIMSNIKRVPPMWPLSKDETISSFEAWRGNFLYTLNLDDNFAPFLDPSKTWEKKIRGGNAHRGLASAQELNFLELMLGQICNYCPIISRNTINSCI